MATAQEFAQAWHRNLFEQDMKHVWLLMTEDFRRVVTQVALGKARERGESVDTVADAFSNAAPVREDLQDFFDVARTIMQKACVASPDSVGPGSTVRVEAPAFEVVRLYVLEDLAIDEAGSRYLPPGASARALTLITTAEDSGSWRISGIGRVMSPGWPPTVSWEPPPEV